MLFSGWLSSLARRLTGPRRPGRRVRPPGVDAAAEWLEDRTLLAATQLLPDLIAWASQERGYLHNWD